ncbi:MAG: alkaline phosphatase family protein [Microthrixaceae bacterium]
MRGSIAAAGTVGLGGSGWVRGCGVAPDPASSAGPAGEAGIDHIVVVMMENRSFDHFLGWLPGADGRQAGLSFTDSDGVSHPTHRLRTYASCEWADPSHSYSGGRTQYNEGRNDGFLRTGPDTFPIGYYEQDDLYFWGRAAPAWTVCDHYFAATMSSTFPNRFYQHAGQSDRSHNTLDISSLPTIWDRLLEKGLACRYYYSDAPFLALWGIRFAPIMRSIDGFLADCRNGRLPNVSFVDPRFLLPPLGNSGDYHPPSDIRAADAFLHMVYEAVTSSPNWDRTVMVVNFDEWGGFYDHVPPSEAPDSNPELALRGFRVPCMVASPFARRGHVAHDVYDHTSVLKMIEWAWDLEPLAPRDAAANNLADVLDLGSRPDLGAPRWDAPPAATDADCTPFLVASLQEKLRDLGRSLGLPTA